MASVLKPIMRCEMLRIASVASRSVGERIGQGVALLFVIFACLMSP
jgi:hypothetical protein